MCLKSLKDLRLKKKAHRKCKHKLICPVIDQHSQWCNCKQCLYNHTSLTFDLIFFHLLLYFICSHIYTLLHYNYKAAVMLDKCCTDFNRFIFIKFWECLKTNPTFRSTMMWKVWLVCLFVIIRYENIIHTENVQIYIYCTEFLLALL